MAAVASGLQKIIIVPSVQPIIFLVSMRKKELGLSVLLIPEVLQKYNFVPSTLFCSKPTLKQLIRSSLVPEYKLAIFDRVLTFSCHPG
jgi:hypothetical protein